MVRGSVDETSRRRVHLNLNCQDFTVNELLEFFEVILESDIWIVKNFMLIGLVRLRLCFNAFDVTLDANFHAI